MLQLRETMTKPTHFNATPHIQTQVTNTSPSPDERAADSSFYLKDGFLSKCFIKSSPTSQIQLNIFIFRVFGKKRDSFPSLSLSSFPLVIYPLFNLAYKTPKTSTLSILRPRLHHYCYGMLYTNHNHYHLQVHSFIQLTA